MTKYAIVVMSEHSEGNPGGQARLLHALWAAKDFADAGQEVGIWFHGVGVTWLAAFTARYDQFTRNYASLFDNVRGNIAGACDFCARTRFGAAEAAEKTGRAHRRQRWPPPHRGGAGRRRIPGTHILSRH